MKESTVLRKLGKFQSVENYNGVPNQFLLSFENGLIFQSYKSIIAVKLNSDTCRIYLGKNWNASNTTGKYRNMFIGYNKAETESKIKAGLYIVMEG